MVEAFGRHLVAIGVPDEDIPQVGKSVELVAEALNTLGYRQTLPELASLQPGVNVPKALSQWARTVSKDDIAILYFAGHGGTIRGRHYLGLPNTDWDYPESEALASEDLFRALAGGTSLMKLLVILDTCYSGQAGFDVQAIAGSLQDNMADRVFCLLVASRPKQQAGDGDFAIALHDLILAQHGSALRGLEIPVLIEDLKPKLPSFQAPAYAQIGLASGQLPDFFPNPHFISEALLERPIEDRQFFRDDLQQHWKPRAIGSEAIFQSGQWYFTGRTVALRRVVAWMNQDEPGKSLMVTGDPGSGKSALLGYLVIAADAEQAQDPALQKFLASMPDGTRPNAGSVTFALALRGLTVADTRQALAERFGVKPEDVLSTLAERTQKTLLVFDALDESVATSDIVDKLLRPLVNYPHLRLLVGTRRPEGKLLGPAFEQLDLDLPAYKSDADVAQYVDRLLLADGEKRATPYRGMAAVAKQVADAVAAEAEGNYLVARTIARALMERDTPINLAVEHIPRNVPAAFGDYLVRLGERSGLGEWRIREMLMPLAYARGQGLPINVWEVFAGGSVEQALDLASAFIGEYREDGRSVYRLYHQALADALHDERFDAERQRKMAQALYDAVPQHDWFRSDWYTRKYFATYAAAGAIQLLESALLDAKFLAVADVPRLLAASAGLKDTNARRRLNWFRLASDRLNEGDEADRLSHLELVAYQNGADDLAAGCAKTGLRRRWQSRWVRWTQQSTPHRVLRGHTDAVTSVALSGGIAVSGSGDHTVRFWDVATGQSIGEVGRHDNRVLAVAADSGVAVSGGWDDTVHLWNLMTGQATHKPMVGHSGVVLSVAIGKGIAVSGAEDSQLIFWDVESGAMLGDPLREHWGAVRSLAMSGDIVMSGGDDGMVRVWSAASRNCLCSLPGPGKRITAVAIGEGVIAAVGDNLTLQTWDLHSYAVRLAALKMELCDSICIGPGVIVCGCTDFKVRVRDLDSGQEKGAGWAGHTLFVRSVSLENGTVASGSADNTVRLWDFDATESIGQANLSYDGKYASVAVAESFVCGATWDHEIKIWDLQTGELKVVAKPGYSRTRGALSLAAGMGVVAYCTGNNEISLLDFQGKIIHRLIEPAWTVERLSISDGILVAAVDDHTIQRWQLATLEPVGTPIEIDSRLNDLIVSNGVIWSKGMKIQGWDIKTGQSVAGPYINDFAGSLVVGPKAAVSGYWTGKLKMWDPATGATIRQGQLDSAARVSQLALYKDFAVTTAGDETVYVWNLATLETILEIKIGSVVNGIAAHPDGICLACAAGLICLELDQLALTQLDLNS